MSENNQRSHSSRSSVALVIAFIALIVGVFALALFIGGRVSGPQTIVVGGGCCCCCGKPRNEVEPEKSYIPLPPPRGKISSVPEPGTLALIAAGAAAIVVLKS